MMAQTTPTSPRTWLLRTHPYLRQSTAGRAQLGTDKDSRGPACGLFRDARSDPLSTSAVPAFCVVSVQQTVTQIL